MPLLSLIRWRLEARIVKGEDTWIRILGRRFWAVGCVLSCACRFTCLYGCLCTGVTVGLWLEKWTAQGRSSASTHGSTGFCLTIYFVPLVAWRHWWTAGLATLTSTQIGNGATPGLKSTEQLPRLFGSRFTPGGVGREQESLAKSLSKCEQGCYSTNSPHLQGISGTVFWFGRCSNMMKQATRCVLRQPSASCCSWN